MNKLLLLTALGLAALSSCKKTDHVDEAPTNPGTPATAIAPEGFNFSTTKNVSLNVRLLTNDDKPLKGVLVDVFSAGNLQSPLFTAISDANGVVSGSISTPAYMDTLVIDPGYIGLMRNAVALVRNNAVSGVIGGSQVFSGDIIPNDDGNGGALVQKTTVQGKHTVLGGTVYRYQGGYDTYGRPTERVPSDVITSELLSFINTSLPETKPVPTYHPDFLESTAETNLNIAKLSDVWVTFVHEGAGYTNTLAYYTYPTNRPPQTQSDLDSIHIIVPNASLSGSGGNMRSGDKVLLGRFKPGTSIGFVLLQNAWNSTTRTVNSSARKYFSNDVLNAENAGFKRHSVLLHDDKNKIFLHGFEDQQRDAGTSDNDFNDLIFYTSSNPVDGISTGNVNPIDKPTDKDGDGVTDVYDKFPNDPTKAYIQYMPAKDTWGTLAFEDLWPSTGDYDVNDLVVGYQYAVINNSQNKTVEMNGQYVIYGIGAGQRNGFGIQLPIGSDKVSSISGQRKIANYITANSNGTEAGQAKAVFFPFDDAQALLPPGVFVNVSNDHRNVKSDTARVTIKFTTPLTTADLGTAPFNPFLIAGQQRGFEVHLPGYKPTDKADVKAFGTLSDKTSPAKNKYYLTAENWPWALHFSEKFEYPTEKNNIADVYMYFLPWARSGGITNTDWYKNKASGYRNQSLIYAP